MFELYGAEPLSSSCGRLICPREPRDPMPLSKLCGMLFCMGRYEQNQLSDCLHRRQDGGDRRCCLLSSKLHLQIQLHLGIQLPKFPISSTFCSSFSN